MIDKLFLSKRNLLTLLSKLDRVKDGEFSYCTLIKCDYLHPKYAQTMEICVVTATEDDRDLSTPSQVYITRSEIEGMLQALNILDIGKITKFSYPDGTIEITALHDESYYTDRPAGEVHEKDDPNLKKGN